MNADHVRFADWDAAYVVGALGSADRRLFEAHLQDCDLCRAAIADLAPTIGLLARVGAERAESLLDAPGEGGGLDPATRARLVARGRRDARRRRVLAGAAGIAAAAVLAVAVAFAVTTSVVPAAVPEEVVALQPVVDVPLSATVELTDVAWGTRIEMICDYAPSDDPDCRRSGMAVRARRHRGGRGHQRTVELARRAGIDRASGCRHRPGPRRDRRDRDPRGLGRPGPDAWRARGMRLCRARVRRRARWLG